MLKEDKEDFKRTRNDNNKYNDDKLLINLPFFDLQPSDKGYSDKDYID
jgi:protein-tyrosine phosphatase